MIRRSVASAIAALAILSMTVAAGTAVAGPKSATSNERTAKASVSTLFDLQRLNGN